MSYAYQTDGIPINVPGQGLYYLFDYARFAGPTLNENNLNESAGMGQRLNFQGTIYGARWWVTDSGRKGVETFDATSNVDWNDNGVIQSGVRMNLNRGGDDKIASLRGGVDEWSRVNFRGGQIGKASIQSNSSMPSEFLYPCMNVTDRPSLPLAAVQNVRRITFQELIAIRKKASDQNPSTPK